MDESASTKHVMGDPRRGKPSWLRVAPRSGENYFALRRLVAEHGLHTICAEGRCPNMAECWEARTATFMILGEFCTRRCTFCNVGYGWTAKVDLDEPRRLAEGIAQLKLAHAVITSVDRDDLADGGAAIFVKSVQAVRERTPQCEIELLIPDFAHKPGALEQVLASRPDVLAHNLETVPRLYRGVRPRSDYRRSLNVLERTHRHLPRPVVKSGIMVGLGESIEELHALMRDVQTAGVDILTIGQYLQPSLRHHRVERFYAPPEFEALAAHGREIGIAHVEAGPLVRSSYHAARQRAATR